MGLGSEPDLYLANPSDANPSYSELGKTCSRALLSSYQCKLFKGSSGNGIHHLFVLALVPS